MGTIIEKRQNTFHMWKFGKVISIDCVREKSCEHKKMSEYPVRL